MLLACARAPKECRDVEDAVAEDDAKVEELGRASAKEPRALANSLRSAADVEDDVAKRLEARKVTSSELAPLVGEYVAFARELAAAARAMGDVLVKLADLRERTDEDDPKSLVGRGDEALARLRARCGAPPSKDCKAVDAARRPMLDRSFGGDDYEAQAAALEQAAGAIDGLAIADAELAKDARAYAEVLHGWAAMLREEKDLLPQVDAAEGALARAAAKERPISSRIDAVCGGAR